MTNNTIIFVRHAETEVDSNIAISNWTLTEKGKQDAYNLSCLDFCLYLAAIKTIEEVV